MVLVVSVVSTVTVSCGWLVWLHSDSIVWMVSVVSTVTVSCGWLVWLAQ